MYNLISSYRGHQTFKTEKRDTGNLITLAKSKLNASITEMFRAYEN